MNKDTFYHYWLGPLNYHLFYLMSDRIIQNLPRRGPSGSRFFVYLIRKFVILAHMKNPMKNLSDSDVKGVLLFFGLVLMIWGGVLVSVGNNLAWMIFSAGGFCLFFAFLSRFKRIKGLWLAAELWEDKMEEAEEVIKSLQSLSVAVSKPIISAITRMGRWDSGMPRREKLDTVKQFENILRGHNVPEDKIDEALQDWHRFNTRDLAAPIVDDMRTHISERIKRVRAEMTSSEEPSELTRLVKISGEIKNIYGMDTPEKIMDMFEKTLGDDACFPGDEREIFFNAHKEEIEDLRYYFKNGNFRRLDHWLALDEKDK